MPIHLPLDVLEKIFTELLKRKDTFALHSCTLVDSSWCVSAIKYLWSHPFKLLEELRQNGYNSSERAWNERASNLIQIYICCIQYQEKMDVNSTERQRTTRQQTCNSAPPAFNYLQYLKCLDIGEFSNAILGMVECTQGKKKFIKIPRYLHHLSTKMTHSTSILGYPKTTAAKPQRLGYNKFISAAAAAAASSNNSSISLNTAKIFNTNILGKILRNQSVCLKTLSISNHEPYSWLHSLPPNTNHHLSYLSKFTCTTPCNAELYYTLSETVINLKKIKIWMDYPPVTSDLSKYGFDSLEAQVRGITVLINSQRKLTHFELGYCGLGLNDIVTALRSQVRTLRKLTFFKVDFKDWGPLLKLTSHTQLDELKLDSCFYLPNCNLNLSNNITNSINNHINNNNNIYMNSSNSRITKMFISSAPSVILEPLIQRANVNLEDLEIPQITCHTNATNSHLPSHNILETILMYSPNLKVAQLCVDSDVIFQLPHFISSCTNLRHLKIYGAKQEINVNRIFQEIGCLGRSVDHNLEELVIHSCWTFTPENFESFLGHFTRLKKFELLWSRCVGNEHFKVLLNRLWCCGRGRGFIDDVIDDDDYNSSYSYSSCQRSSKKRDNGSYGKGKNNYKYWKGWSNKRNITRRGKYNYRFENKRSCIESNVGGGGGKEIKSISKLEYLSIQTKHIINVDLIQQIRRFVKYVKVFNWEI